MKRRTATSEEFNEHTLAIARGSTGSRRATPKSGASPRTRPSLLKSRGGLHDKAESP